MTGLGTPEGRRTRAVVPTRPVLRWTAWCGTRFSRWDGTQEPFGPDVPASDLLEELSDDVLMGEQRRRRPPPVDAPRDAGPVQRARRPACASPAASRRGGGRARPRGPVRGAPRPARGAPGPRTHPALVRAVGRRALPRDVPRRASTRRSRADPRAAATTDSSIPRRSGGSTADGAPEGTGPRRRTCAPWRRVCRTSRPSSSRGSRTCSPSSTV